MLNAKQFIGNSFPPDEGRNLADAFLAEPPGNPGDLAVNLIGVPAETLISAFFLAFFQRVREKDPGRLGEAARINWRTDHAFQAETIQRYSRDAGKVCTTWEDMQEREHPKPREAVFRSTRSSAGPDAHRDMDGFDPDEELARLRLALRSEGGEARTFALEAVENLDEYITRGGRLPRAWHKVALSHVMDYFRSSSGEILRFSHLARDFFPVEDMPSGTFAIYHKDPNPAAYTIGRTSSYDRSLAEDPEVKKIGKSDDYEGGWVFRTPEEAQNFLGSHDWKASAGSDKDPADYSVYELEMPGSWEDCASMQPGEDGVHRLLKDARIIRKVRP